MYVASSRSLYLRQVLARLSAKSVLRAIAVFVGLTFPFPTLSGQTNTLVNEGSVPTPGVGHDPIYGLSETVSPANGSLFLKIDLPTPKARGFTLPFALTYNSGAVHRFSSGVAGGGGLDDFQGSSGLRIDRAHDGNGWSDTLPYTTASHFVLKSASPLAGPGITTTCEFLSSYNFYDMNGGSHPLGLALIGGPEAIGTQVGRDTCAAYRYASYNYAGSASGGDDEVSANGSYCPGYDDQSSACEQGSFTVTDLNGIRYYFRTSIGVAGGGPYVNPYSLTDFITPTSIEDKNGNVVTLSGGYQGTIVRTSPSYIISPPGLPIIDTVGRTVLSASNSSGSISAYPYYGGGGNATTALQVGGLSYGLTYTTTQANYTVQSLQVQVPDSKVGCAFVGSVSGETVNGIQTVSAPDGTSYTFHYEPVYGLVSEIDYPSGGWVKYDWKLSDTLAELATFDGAYQAFGPETGTAQVYVSSGACNYEYQTPVIAKRTVGYTSSSIPAQTQTFNYGTSWNGSGQWTSKVTTVVTTDNVTGQVLKTVYTYGSVARPVQVNEGGHAQAQLPVESSVQYYDLGTASAPKNLLMKSTNKTWADQYEMTSEQTTLAGGQAKWTAYCYFGPDDRPEEIDEYGYGSSGPTLNPAGSGSGTPQLGRVVATCDPSSSALRKTGYGYAFDTRCAITVYDGNGTVISDMEGYVDNGTHPCISGKGSTTAATVSSSTRDPAYAAANNVARGNLTQVNNLVASGSSITTTATYDETGQITSVTDGCGNTPCGDMQGSNHTTIFAYADNFADSGPASGATNAYVTSVTTPSPSGRTMRTSYSYRYLDGKISSITDPNYLTTRYSYNDPLRRLTAINGPPDPNNGDLSSSLQYNYTDGIDATTVMTSQLLEAQTMGTGPTATTALTTKKTTNYYDGFGHLTRSELTSDPGGISAVSSVYNGMGQVYSVTNPQRGTPATTDATVTMSYDAIGRKLVQTNQRDGSSSSWCYNGVSGGGCNSNASTASTASWVDHTDESGRQIQQVTDALGRLTAVIEPDPKSGGLALETDYTYDSLNNLTSVTQSGSHQDTPRTMRQFSYDYLGRLLTSFNPEAGLICYGPMTNGKCAAGYDANGNLGQKTDSRGITTNYTYDVLNRLVAKTFTADPTNTPSSCFAYDTVSANGIGRLAASWTQSGACSGTVPANGALTQRNILAYDVMGHVTQTQQCMLKSCGTSTGGSAPFTLNLNYDLAGNLTRWDDGLAQNFFTQNVNAANQPQTLTSAWVSPVLPENLFANPSYGPTGALLNWTFGNNLNVTRSFDPHLRITDETVKHP